MHGIKIAAGTTEFNELMWLLKFKYRPKATSDYFYYYTVHIEKDWMITTDGEWMRMLLSQGNDPGDYTIKMEKNSLELIEKQSDRFWHFPATWKRILSPIVMPESEGILTKKALTAHLYKMDLRVPIEQLVQLEDGRLYQVHVWRDSGLVVLEEQTKGRYITVLTTEATDEVEAIPAGAYIKDFVSIFEEINK